MSKNSSLNFNTLIIAGAVVAGLYFAYKIFKGKETEYTFSSSGQTGEATQSTIKTDIRQAEQTERTETRQEEKTERTETRQEEKTKRTESRQKTAQTFIDTFGRNYAKDNATSKYPKSGYASGEIKFGGGSLTVSEKSPAKEEIIRSTIKTASQIIGTTQPSGKTIKNIAIDKKGRTITTFKR